MQNEPLVENLRLKYSVIVIEIISAHRKKDALGTNDIGWFAFRS